MLERRLQQNGS